MNLKPPNTDPPMTPYLFELPPKVFEPTPLKRPSIADCRGQKYLLEFGFEAEQEPPKEEPCLTPPKSQ